MFTVTQFAGYGHDLVTCPDLCVHEGVGIIPWSPLARGLLARPRPATDAPATTRADTDGYQKQVYTGNVDWAIIDAVQRIAAARNVPASQVALAWLLSRPAVTAPIVGATKLEHLHHAIAAVDVELTSEEIMSTRSVKG